GDYAERFADDLDRNPFDGDVVRAAFGSLPSSSAVLDIGCGPAQLASRLAESGLSPVGLDLTPAMLAIARRRRPDLPLVCGDVLRLSLRSEHFAGAVAWYSLHNLPRELLSTALDEIRR